MSSSAVGLDLRLWSHPGIGRYIRELVGAMFRLEGPGRFRLLVNAREEEAVRGQLKDALCERARSPIYGLAEQAELSRFSGRVKLLHVPHFNAPLFCRARLVVTVHDLIYLKESRFSGSFLGKFYVRTLLGGVQRNARAVIAVSDFTRRDLETEFPRMAGRIQVIHEAASAPFAGTLAASAGGTLEKHGLKPGYVLFVGSLKAHKNLPVLLDAHTSLWRENKITAPLVIVGKKDPKERALLARLAAAGPEIRYLGQQSDEALAALYRSAAVLVIPSLWEGFGLTAVEAMACGTPVIASERASLPEVVGGAGLLFDPERADRLAGLLENVLKDGALRKELSRKGLERAGQFSWERAARETLKLYEKASA